MPAKGMSRPDPAKAVAVCDAGKGFGTRFLRSTDHAATAHTRLASVRHRNIWDGKAASEAGPLDAHTRRLLKLALAIGAGSEGAVHSHTRQGLAEGLSAEEITQVAVLAITTLGFPSAMAGLSWMRDILCNE